MLKQDLLPGLSRATVSLCLVAGSCLGGHVLAEGPAVSPSDELVETTFEGPRTVLPQGTVLTDEEQQALWGKGMLVVKESVASERAWPLFEGVAEQYVDAELTFATPAGSIVSIPPRTLTLASKAGQIKINQVMLRYSKDLDSSRRPGFYLVPIDKGLQLLIVRAAVKDPRTTSAALVCMNVVYEQIPGLDRLPGEEDQVPSVAQQVTFSLQSLASSSYQSGVKPGVVRVFLDKVIGLPEPTLRNDQSVGRNPTARLVYEPSAKSEPQLFADSGTVEASSSWQITAHAWSGDELKKSVADSLTIRRIAVDDDVRRKLQRVIGPGRRLKGAIECIFARWQHREEITRSVDKQGELHALIKRAGG